MPLQLAACLSVGLLAAAAGVTGDAMHFARRVTRYESAPERPCWTLWVAGKRAPATATPAQKIPPTNSQKLHPSDASAKREQRKRVEENRPL